MYSFSILASLYKMYFISNSSHNHNDPAIIKESGGICDRLDASHDHCRTKPRATHVNILKPNVTKLTRPVDLVIKGTCSG